MTFLLFYGVIKFLLITLPQKSSKGCVPSRERPIQLGKCLPVHLCDHCAIKDIYNVHYGSEMARAPSLGKYREKEKGKGRLGEKKRKQCKKEKMSWYTLCPSHANHDLSGARLALPSNEFSMQPFIPTSKIITTQS